MQAFGSCNISPRSPSTPLNTSAPHGWRSTHNATVSQPQRMLTTTSLRPGGAITTLPHDGHLSSCHLTPSTGTTKEPPQHETASRFSPPTLLPPALISLQASVHHVDHAEHLVVPCPVEAKLGSPIVPSNTALENLNPLLVEEVSPPCLKPGQKTLQSPR